MIIDHHLISFKKKSEGVSSATGALKSIRPFITIDVAVKLLYRNEKLITGSE